MANILKLPVQPVKFGFKRVKKKNEEPTTDQLSLFHPQRNAKVVAMPLNLKPFEHALLLDERGDSNAKDLYWKAINAGDCVADAFCNLGILESQNGQTPDAFDCFTQSLKHDPRHLESHYNLANLYFDSGDFKLAKLHYQLASEVDPNFPNTYFNWGLVLALNNEFKPAIEVLQKYRQLVPPADARIADDLLSTLQQSIQIKK